MNHNVNCRGKGTFLKVTTEFKIPSKGVGLKQYKKYMELYSYCPFFLYENIQIHRDLCFARKPTLTSQQSVNLNLGCIIKAPGELLKLTEKTTSTWSTNSEPSWVEPRQATFRAARAKKHWHLPSLTTTVAFPVENDWTYQLVYHHFVNTEDTS